MTKEKALEHARHQQEVYRYKVKERPFFEEEAAFWDIVVDALEKQMPDVCQIGVCAIAFYEALVSEEEGCKLDVSKLNFVLNALREMDFAEYVCDLSDVIAMAEEDLK